MSARVLVDTNVLVYAYDRSDPERQQRAFEVLDRLSMSNAGVFSTQVFSEFFVAVTRRSPLPFLYRMPVIGITNYLQSWTILEITGMIVLEAARGVRDHRFSFWNAQIWATARLNQISVVLARISTRNRSQKEFVS
ncbi:PIN domain-containing protein [Roseiflexus castenholzii]|jgi:predicted nucleic acid-binding protein|uniref:PilT protein-like protein n=1 Tax=Roseiflexus castenholzii (strain DSM 13941 / HLO8) TaxID=383372 RepID=A7NIG3_ROSCS|nr:PIN domain-containing protein [Roseiflexus castenholzii]ABU57263.1 PilT protein-like protein [Roseiflexus castenholzii DSM 13941]